jgi:hypothetical protein
MKRNVELIKKIFLRILISFREWFYNYFKDLFVHTGLELDVFLNKQKEIKFELINGELVENCYVIEKNINTAPIASRNYKNRTQWFPIRIFLLFYINILLSCSSSVYSHWAL